MDLRSSQNLKILKLMSITLTELSAVAEMSLILLSDQTQSKNEFGKSSSKDKLTLQGTLLVLAIHLGLLLRGSPTNLGNTGIPDQPFHSMPITDSNLFRSVIPIYADQASHFLSGNPRILWPNTHPLPRTDLRPFGNHRS